jgi:hypothetical protein
VRLNGGEVVVCLSGWVEVSDRWVEFSIEMTDHGHKCSGSPVVSDRQGLGDIEQGRGEMTSENTCGGRV